MANYLDANPEMAAAVANWRQLGLFVPVMHTAGVRAVARYLMDRVTLRTPLPAEDYVIGLELLGFRLSVVELVEGQASLLVMEPEGDLPEAWDAHARRLMAAFKQAKRQRLAIEFLRERDGNAC